MHWTDFNLFTVWIKMLGITSVMRFSILIRWSLFSLGCHKTPTKYPLYLSNEFVIISSILRVRRMETNWKYLILLEIYFSDVQRKILLWIPWWKLCAVDSKNNKLAYYNYECLKTYTIKVNAKPEGCIYKQLIWLIT